jgi:hypothetical protein
MKGRSGQCPCETAANGLGGGACAFSTDPYFRLVSHPPFPWDPAEYFQQLRWHSKPPNQQSTPLPISRSKQASTSSENCTTRYWRLQIVKRAYEPSSKSGGQISPVNEYA